MPLGRFGGSSRIIRVQSIGSREGPDAGNDRLLQEARDILSPSPEGMPVESGQLHLLTGGLGNNLIVQGSFESWSSGTTSAPDGWTLTGAGATIARDVTNVQDGLAGSQVTAALNTATNLAQSITISGTQNTRLRSRFVTFSARVLTSSSNRVFLRIGDGTTNTDSPFHTGGGAFETLVVTQQLSSTVTSLTVSFQISSGASISATIDAAILVEGQTPSAFTGGPRDPFAQPRQINQTNAGTNTSTTYVDISGLSMANVIVDGNQSVMITFSMTHQGNTLNVNNFFQILRDATVIQQEIISTVFVTGVNIICTFVVFDVKPASGNYTYKAQGKVGSASTATYSGNMMNLVIIPTA